MSPPYLLSQEEYDAALSQGHTAIHLTQRKGSSLFSIEVGNLRAMEEALVVFSYVRLLNSVAGSLEFEHIATWVPPYTRGGASAAAVSPDDLTYSTKVGYSLSYKIKLHSSRGFRSIESPSAVTITEEGPDLRVVTLAESVTNPSRDLTLLVELPPLSEGSNQLLIQEVVRAGGKKKTVGLATFIPRQVGLRVAIRIRPLGDIRLLGAMSSPIQCI